MTPNIQRLSSRGGRKGGAAVSVEGCRRRYGKRRPRRALSNLSRRGRRLGRAVKRGDGTNRTLTVLVADDDAAVRDILSRMLEAEFLGASIVRVSDPDRVMELALGLRPNLIFLDWVFPGGKTGHAVCRRLKSQPSTRRVPVVLMTGMRTGLRDRFKSVACGADLYLQKPFTREEVLGYSRALLEKSPGRAAPSLLRRSALTLQKKDRTVWWQGKRLCPLPSMLFNLLWFLACRSPEPVPVPQLVFRVWNRPVRERYVKVAVERLRWVLRSVPALRIESVPRAGYRLTIP